MPPPINNQIVPQAQLNPPKSGKSALAVLVGTIAAGVLYVTIPRDEGTKYIGYLDMVGIPTKCTGDTTGVTVGKRYTDAECRASLDRQLVLHAAPVMRCTPGLAGEGHDYQRAAAVSLAYNIGPSNYCRSSAARLFNAHQYKAACDAFLPWNRAGGRVVAGLAARRARERVLCLRGIST